ncbi:MAG: hypothetical protein Q8L66_01425 [Caulobacter sp.]|nr:hypothetical protein [Caulobacter sp.]
MTDKTKIQGEGDYEAARRFQKDEHEFARTAPVGRLAREAEEALDGPEGEALEKARVETAEGKTGQD